MCPSRHPAGSSHSCRSLVVPFFVRLFVPRATGPGKCAGPLGLGPTAIFL